jgi:DNA polymerase (family 10)
MAGEQEKDVYTVLDLSYIPPELRENRGEIQAAQKKNLPQIIAYDEIRGDLHIHTTYSDGQSSLREITAMATTLNYQYIGITDHSQSLKIARGLSVEKLKKQIREIREINKNEKMHVFAGIECDIKTDGTLDYPNRVLKELDFVYASIHTKFDMTQRKMTQRILDALGNDYVTILGHPTGRLIGRRDPYGIDLEKIAQVAHDNHIYLEINAFPDRLDLNDINARHAKELGAQMALGTDSHNINHLRYMRYGIATARRGWLEKKDILNTHSLNELKKIFRCA